MPAKSLEDIFDFFKNEPIPLSKFDQFYVDADNGRGKPVKKRLERILRKNPKDKLKFLFAGHKGCGKSTELNRLQKELDQDFIVLNFSIVQELDVVNISYIELFIAVMEKLFKLVESSGIKIDPLFIKNITNWIASKEIAEIQNDYLEIGIEVGAEAKSEIPFLTKFFAKFRAAAKSSSSLKEVLKQKIEPKLSELISNCNMLIREIKKNLPKMNKKGLLIIVEDLDKIDIKKGMDIFYLHSTQLTQLACNCIYTFPIALRYNTKFLPTTSNYDQSFVLPMIKVNTRKGSPFEEGQNVLKEIVKQRMPISLFENETILLKMIKISGGCMWDLFRLIKEAAENALDFERSKITDEDYHAAYVGMKADYVAQIAENSEFTVDDYYEALSECLNDLSKQPKSSKIMLDLRNNLSVLNYNGEDWSDVHPIVKDILEEKQTNGQIITNTSNITN